MPLAVMSAFICLGKKYDIPKLYLEALKKVYREVPATLADYDALPTEWTLLDDSLEYMDFTILARKSGLLSILPFALYQCCLFYSTETIINGLQSSDGRNLSLPLQDQFACLGGYRACCEIQATTTFAWIHDSDRLAPSCTKPEDCKKAKQDYNLKHFNSSPDLDGLNEWCYCTPPGLCDECIEEGRLKHGVGREEFWDKLPGIFNLPPWTELLKERQEMYIDFKPTFPCALIASSAEIDTLAFN